jgi:hypothetical protein
MNTDKRWPRTDSKRTRRYEKKKVYANIRNDEKYILICRRESKKTHNNFIKAIVCTNVFEVVRTYIHTYIHTYICTYREDKRKCDRERSSVSGTERNK